MSNCCCYSKCSQNINNRCVANISDCKNRKVSFNALDWYRKQKENKED